MGIFSYATNELTTRNAAHEITKMACRLAGITAGDASEFHRHLQVLIYCDSEKVCQLARWW